jgi:hypothetical protein
MDQRPSLEAEGRLANQEISRFFETRRFIIVFTKPSHWTLSWDRLIQSTPSHTISLRSVSMLPFPL